jgi:AcrR family transcriptional regulator
MVRKTGMPQRRQKRGERRIDSLLAAAERVIAEMGYEQATTNHIAERASASPGTLYQFFPNKQAIAEALAERYAARLSSLAEETMRPEMAQLPLARLVDHILDPFLAFHNEAPAFDALFLASGASAELHRRVANIEAVAVNNLVRIFALRAQRRSSAELRRVAEFSVMTYRGVLPLILSSDKKRHAEAIRELKALLERYLKPVLGDRGPIREE